MDEACKILNVPEPTKGAAPEVSLQELEKVRERFKKMFDINDPKKGGSFYLQSKVLRARERIEAELREAQEMAEMEEEASQGGWKPKMYKD
jgi:mitochondrial import inner membrane translocase subunit TIM16